MMAPGAVVRLSSIIRSTPFVVFAEYRGIATRPPLYKTNWKKDIVYLYQFPRAPVAPNLSQFCLKLETFLRANHIKYEQFGSYTRKSERGLLPFVELNGKQLADSQLIIWELEKHFNIEYNLTPEEKGMVRAVERMIDCSTNYALQQDKIVRNGHLFLARNVSGLPLPSFLTNFLGSKMAGTVRKRVAGALGKLTKEEVDEVLRRDIAAIDAILGEKKFLFGNVITSADCSAFGHLGTTYFLPYRQQITDLLEDDFPRVRQYVQRIRNHFYPEWKDE